MDKTTGTGADMVTIVTEPDALTFATRKEWQRLPEMFLGELSHHETVMVFCGTRSIFFLMRSMDPQDYLSETGDMFRLVRICMDEETGKQVFYTVKISRAEAALLMRNHLTLWE